VRCSSANHQQCKQNVEIMQQNCLAWFGELETLLQVASVEFSGGAADASGDAWADGAALDLVSSRDTLGVGAASKLTTARSVATASV